MTKQIPLNGKHGQGKFAIVDDADYEFLNQYRWHYHKGKKANTGYAFRHIRLSTSKHSIKPMHREILDATQGFDIDHINGDGLDNRRKNLRLATRSQNNQNSRPRRNKKSRYKGVSFNKNSNLWTANIAKEGSKYSIGYFYTEREAAIAYNSAAQSLFGEYARLNDIPQVQGNDCIPTKESNPPSSEFIGVSWDKNRLLWSAEFSYQNKRYRIGRFASEIEAAQARDKVALEILGNKAKLNFP